MRRGRIWRKIRWSLRRKSSWLCRQLFREMLIRTCQRSFPCTELHTDGIRNAIPTHVEIKGDTRSFAPEVQMLLEERMRTISEAICAMHGATCQFSLYP